MAGLRLEHIYKVYPNGTKAVSNFTMDIEDKEFIVFVGPSGCGKSTTLRMIAGLEDISAGELYIGDRIVNDVEPKDRDIAMVFQNYALYPHMTVYENMAFGLKLRHVPNDEIHEKVLWAAKVLDLTEYLDRKPKAMSGGQRQRVSLGRAILRNPKVMLLDEPLSNLDAKLRAQMRSEIAKLHENLQTTFIYVTHDQVEAMTLGTRVVVMRLGEIMQIDTPKNLYDYPNNLFVAGFIGTPQMNFFHATLKKVKEKIHIDFKWSEDSIDVPQAKLAKVQPQYFDGKKEIIVGIRCEDISLDPEVVAKSNYLIDVKISHFEELGNETLIYADINRDGDGFSETSTRAIIKGRSNYGLQKGQIVKAALDVSRMHMFDKETENTINPRVPHDNLITCEISKGKLKMGEYVCDIPPVINLKDGYYDLLIPTSAITLTKDDKHAMPVASLETVGDIELVGLGVADQVLFTTVNKDQKVGKSASFELDFTQIEFRQNGEVVKEAINEFDTINGIFINHDTAKHYVGNKYESVIDERIAEVEKIYEPKIQALKEKYDEDVQHAYECAKVNQNVNEKVNGKVDEKVNEDETHSKINPKGAFDGSVLEMIGMNIVWNVLTFLTLGIAYPFILCWKKKWYAKHTIYDGKRLSFDGNGEELIGKWLLWMLLTIVTLGIYGLFVPKKILEWEASHTHIEEDHKNYRGAFDGSVLEMIGISLLSGLITFITLGIAVPFVYCWREKWLAKHTVYDGKRLSFDGNGGELIGKWLLWMLLTFVTFGIYGLFVPKKFLDWKAYHTHIKGYTITNVEVVNSDKVVNSDTSEIKDKSTLNAVLAQKKAEFKEKKRELEREHSAKNVEIINAVNEMYAKIRRDELESFENFKKINKDRDAYRKRAAEIRVFKENFKLEKKNELDKRLNLEAMRFETELNTLKGSYKRNKNNLKKEYKDFVAKCYNDAHPVEVLTKAFNKEAKALNAEYQHQLDLANVIFFFKTNDLITLSSDAISNKMVQSLGIKVFTKQYLLEIPHDAYYEAEEGLDLEVVELLDYGTKKFLRCKYEDESGVKDLYLQTEKTKAPSSKITVKFDVSKIHITEKSMEIKIY
ncbi:MAG: sn-glycerol-3-phosphate ABC transporter ATP-binding protein UgpC [Erysipelotrichales bacterium]|nr:sn-glycerol-3-phosphate ABC transporter ATP-binding protein UgpC [Erysipelotrichales bacterium]